MNNKKAIIFGATGFVGGYLLTNLLNSTIYESVTVVVRKPLNLQHPKLKIIIADFNSLTNFETEIVADDVFITLGTTKAKTPNQNEYYKIDHDYPVLAAKIAQRNGAKNVLLLTAVGANAKSSVFYIKTKGDVENDIIALNYAHTHIFRPSMIMGNRAEKRTLEQIFLSFWGGLNALFIGKMRKYKGILAQDIAKAMFNAAQKNNSSLKIYHWDEMKSLL